MNVFIFSKADYCKCGHQSHYQSFKVGPKSLSTKCMNVKVMVSVSLCVCVCVCVLMGAYVCAINP